MMSLLSIVFEVCVKCWDCNPALKKASTPLHSSLPEWHSPLWSKCCPYQTCLVLVTYCSLNQLMIIVLLCYHGVSWVGGEHYIWRMCPGIRWCIGIGSVWVHRLGVNVNSFLHTVSGVHTYWRTQMHHISMTTTVLNWGAIPVKWC